MARIITGVGTGHLNVVVPVWSAETSGHLSRGFFIALEFTLNIFGGSLSPLRFDSADGNI